LSGELLPSVDEQHKIFFGLTPVQWTLLAYDQPTNCPPIRGQYAAIGDNILADAILDKLMHNAHRWALKGESMRKRLQEID